MNKAILIIDMPESCDKCPLLLRHEEERCCIPEGRNSFTTKPSWCPLKPLPEKYEIDRYKCNDQFYQFKFERGYNQCIDKIVGSQK